MPAFETLLVKWKYVFQHLDATKDGYVSVESAYAICRKYNEMYDIKSSVTRDGLLRPAVVMDKAIESRFGKSKIAVSLDEFLEAVSYYYLKHPRSFQEYYRTYFNAVFDVIDRDGAGYATSASFQQYYKRYGDNADNCHRGKIAFSCIDKDDNGHVTREKYVDAYMKYIVDPQISAEQLPLY